MVFFKDVVVASNRIKHIHLKIGIVEQEGLMLGVHIYEQGAQLSDLIERNGRVVDEGAALASVGQLAANGALIVVVVQVMLFKERCRLFVQLTKGGLYYASLGRGCN